MLQSNAAPLMVGPMVVLPMAGHGWQGADSVLIFRSKSRILGVAADIHWNYLPHDTWFRAWR